MPQNQSAQPLPAPTPAPQVVPPQHSDPPSRSKTPWIVGIVAAAGVAGLLWSRQSPQTGGGGTIADIKSITVASDSVQKTIRLAGATAAERYADMQAPRIVGGRGSVGQGGPSAAFSRTGSGGSTFTATVGGRGGGTITTTVGAGGGGVTTGGGGGGDRAGGGGRGGGTQPGAGLAIVSMAPAGANVKAGDVVAAFDPENQLLVLDNYKSSLEQTEAAFKQMLAGLDLNTTRHNQSLKAAQATYDKAVLDLKTVPVRSKMDTMRYQLLVDEASAKLNQLKQEIPFVEAGNVADRKVAEAELEKTRLEQKRAQENLQKLTLKAPIDGLVVYQSLSRNGEMIQFKVGDQVGVQQTFMKIVDLSSLLVKATVNQTDSDSLRVGQKAFVRFDAFPDLVISGKVFSIGSVGTASQQRADWVRAIPVVVKLDRTDPRVLPDLSVSVDVVLNSEEGQPVVPLETVNHDPKNGASKFVYVKSAAGWQKRDVQLGLSSNTKAVVKSGLKAGEIVALQAPPMPKTGSESR